MAFFSYGMRNKACSIKFPLPLLSPLLFIMLRGKMGGEGLEAEVEGVEGILGVEMKVRCEKGA